MHHHGNSGGDYIEVAGCADFRSRGYVHRFVRLVDYGSGGIVIDGDIRTNNAAVFGGEWGQQQRSLPADRVLSIGRDQNDYRGGSEHRNLVALHQLCTSGGRGHCGRRLIDMALIPEDGTGLATADSYCSQAEATTYHAAIGNAAWALLSSDAKDQAIRKATIYMVGEYRLNWAGTRMTATQALDWPRSLVPRKDVPFLQYYADNATPQEVKNACAVLALKASTADLLSDQTQRKSSVTIGPISTTYSEGSRVAKKYSAIDAMLRPFLLNGTGQVRMVRV